MKKSEIKALIFIVFIIILFLINSFFTKIFSDYGIVTEEGNITKETVLD